MNPTILAIETSCDETSASVISGGKILANVTATQEIHAQYGGVIPELASRSHDLFISTVVKESLNKAGIGLEELHAIAVTQGPGLLGALLVGNTFAKGLAWSLSLPLIGINHLDAHIAALFIENKEVQFPIITLLVSGGHTQLVKVNSYTDFEILGQTIDDAAGEAYDKSAKLLGLPYPGGPELDKFAKNGNPLAFTFADPKVPGYNFSFSGLKTSILYSVRDSQKIDPDFISNNLEDLCASIQHTINTYLLKKLNLAIQKEKPKTIAIAGGVSANSDLRNKVLKLAEKTKKEVLIPKLEYCTDNAAMIAMAAHFAYGVNRFMELDSVPFTR